MHPLLFTSEKSLLLVCNIFEDTGMLLITALATDFGVCGVFLMIPLTDDFVEIALSLRAVMNLVIFPIMDASLIYIR